MALYLDGQKIISGESGSSGHTIVDNEGVSLEQRTNLQFKGAYSEDNSTDDTTEVNVVREMTKAEFDLLSADEKVGIINVTDVTGGEEDKFQPVIYSEDEREIGVYTDGKPLYEKTIYSATVTVATEVAHNIANIDKVAEVKCNIMRYNSWNSGNFIFEDANRFSVVVSKTSYYCVFAPATGVYSNLYLTIRYTKTTDAPGSGKWTPQGVPAVHYSENEQVIGTWIDGSTVYEKVIDLGTNTNIDYQSWTLTSVSLSSVSRLISISALSGDGNAFYGDLLGGNNNGYLQLLTTRNEQSVIVRYIIFRYTKSST